MVASVLLISSFTFSMLLLLASLRMQIFLLGDVVTARNDLLLAVVAAIDVVKEWPRKAVARGATPKTTRLTTRESVCSLCFWNMVLRLCCLSATSIAIVLLLRLVLVLAIFLRIGCAASKKKDG